MFTALLFPAGCGSEAEYSIYTNMPDESFEILDKSYKAGDKIAGLNLSDTENAETDTSNYTAKSDMSFAMTTTAEYVVYSDFSTEDASTAFNNFSKEVKAKLYEIEKAISSSVTNSDIYNFNNANAGEKLQIKKITYEVLSEAKSVYTFTEGYYNPALYYNVQAYGFGGADFYPQTLPDDNLIAKYTDLATHFGELQLSEEEGNYYVVKPEYTVEVDGQALSMKLDLGGIGKGYAVDCVDALMEAYGYNYGYFSFGTSSMLVKNNLEGGNFSLGLSGPRSPSRNVYLSTSIRNEKLSTSGDNEQRYFIDGVRYCHIIDPTTGKPVQTGIMSATVIGGGAAEDDALTTALMCMGREKAVKFIEEKLTDRRVVFTVDD